MPTQLTCYLPPWSWVRERFLLHVSWVMFSCLVLKQKQKTKTKTKQKQKQKNKKQKPKQNLQTPHLNI